MPGQAMFQLTGASFAHDDQLVLHDISLEIRDGEKVALVGPSGAGKSTLLSLLWKQQPDAVALCPQESGLVDLFSTYQNIYMGGLSRFSTLYNLINLIRPWAARREEVARVARTLGIEEKLWNSPDQLSGGQRQRVALGRALYRNKSVFMGDEPVSSLDPEQGEQLLMHVLQQHTTAIVAIHSPELAAKHFDRIIALKDGRIFGDWQAAELDLSTLESVYQDA